MFPFNLSDLLHLDPSLLHTPTRFPPPHSHTASNHAASLGTAPSFFCSPLSYQTDIRQSSPLTPHHSSSLTAYYLYALPLPAFCQLVLIVD